MAERPSRPSIRSSPFAEGRQVPEVLVAIGSALGGLARYWLGSRLAIPPVRES